MVESYWLIGQQIVEHEQHGEARANYGKGLLKELAARLTTDFGKGFDERELRKMRQFYQTFPKRDTLRPELTYRMIIVESKRKKAAIERKQNKACLGYAEYEQARLYVKAATILKKYPDAILADVTSGSKDGLVKLSPFYPHGGIPVPFTFCVCRSAYLSTFFWYSSVC